MAVGLMSAGMGSVPAAQTYLDVSQGNRVFDSLYDRPLPGDVGGGICGPAYSRAVVERAESAPADIVPGLLARTLREAGEGCAVRSAGLARLPALVRSLPPGGLLVAIERAPPAKNGALAIGIAGKKFSNGVNAGKISSIGADGGPQAAGKISSNELTSDSTRTKGYVLSTDVAPTILRHLGLAVPAAMSGQPIRAEGGADVDGLESLAARMASISDRRGPVIGGSLLAWLLACGLAILLTRGRAAPVAVELLALGVVYLPLLLLLCAALEPSRAAEQLVVAAGAPAVAALTLAACRGYRAIALASGLVAGAYAIDVVAGSPLTKLSLLGPNPGLGARFYGIGNELEALLAVLVVAGTGAALRGFAPGWSGRRAATAFLATGLAFAFVFAAGRFGADVGAAIVMPIGAAAATVSKVATPRRRTALALIIAGSIAFMGFISLIDLITGANAHLTRSVLDAGGLGDLGQVAQRRLQLSAGSFARPVVFVFLPLLAALVALAVRRRATLRGWLADAPAVEAGLLGALAAIVVGTLANDSGALVLEIGAVYLLAFAGFAWAERPGGRAAGAGAVGR